jgi:hypothetical protein
VAWEVPELPLDTSELLEELLSEELDVLLPEELDVPETLEVAELEPAAVTATRPPVAASDAATAPPMTALRQRLGRRTTTGAGVGGGSRSMGGPEGTGRSSCAGRESSSGREVSLSMCPASEWVLCRDGEAATRSLGILVAMTRTTAS